jgi:hypothetical protein
MVCLKVWKKGNSRQSCRLPEWSNQRVVLRLRVSPKIQNQTRKSSTGSARDLCRSDIFKKMRKTGSLPCPFSKSANWQLNPELRNRKKQLAKQGKSCRILYIALNVKGKKRMRPMIFTCRGIWPYPPLKSAARQVTKKDSKQGKDGGQCIRTGRYGLGEESAKDPN